jgi:hypothetical protein
MSLDKLGGKSHSQGKDSSTSVFDQQNKILLESIYHELRCMRVMLNEISGLYPDMEDLEQ